MAGKLVTLALDLPVRMHPSQRLVLVAIADHANERDGCLAWPSNATLARRTGIGERQVQEHRIALETQGLIALVSSARGGRGRAKVYRLEVAKMLHELASIDAKKAAVHFRELRKIPGALPLGFVLQNPAARHLKVAVQRKKPSGPAQETQRPTATEPKAFEPKAIEPESFEPARGREGNGSEMATSMQNRLTELLKPIEPDPARPHMSREQQIVAARRLAKGEL